MADELYLRAPNEKRRPPPGMAAVIHLDEPGLPGYPLHHNLSRLPAAPGLPGQAVTAFLLAALGVWAADKFLPRRAAPDAWTRQITLNLPVSPDWLPLAPRLEPPPQFSHRGRLDPEAPGSVPGPGPERGVAPRLAPGRGDAVLRAGWIPWWGPWTCWRPGSACSW